MCGIVGVISKSHFGFMQKHLDLFYQLLHSDELRGDDATGLIYIENDSGFGILKDAVPASWCADSMIRHNQLTDRIRKGKALIGHNRKATMGRSRKRLIRLLLTKHLQWCIMVPYVVTRS